MIEVNKNTLASALPALGKLICRTSPLALCKSIKVEAAEGKLRLATCGLNEEVSFELETGKDEGFCCIVGFDEFRDAVRGGRNKTVGLSYEASPTARGAESYSIPRNFFCSSQSAGRPTLNVAIETCSGRAPMIAR